ncbi:hypothetical protein A6A40_02995 [Azospirillum humicireducens]|uniref:GGDEF domain-containing protein n=1 Tax=Azospirillum humicireducens TaxID=1226968 RepID=A0A160JDW9_9PROT|nr:hypothetical protein [Azospirillum humicireducens]ANC90953.1 hypothetical protein A6A40_02995 [Azospirillum humicireducens]
MKRSLALMRRLLRQWFSQGWAAGELAGEASPPSSVGQPARTVRPSVEAGQELRVLEQRLWRLLMQPAVASTGRVHLLDLGMMRDRLGTGWTALRPRILTAADGIIDRHLTRNDIRFRTAGDDYILVFASLERHAASLVCARIAQELLQLFLGDDRSADLRVSTAVGVADGQIRFEHAFATSLLAEARARTELAGGSAGGSAGGAFADGSPVMTGPIFYAEDAGGKARPVLRQLRLPPDDAARFGIRYRPVWDITQQVISTYMGTPVRIFPDESFIEGTAALNSLSDAMEILQLDADALVESVEILNGLFRNKSRLLMSVPICFETLAARRTRLPFLEICQSIPDYLRRFLIFELLRFPPGVPTGRLSELLHEIRPYCRWTFMRVEFKSQSFSGFAGTGLNGITVAMPADRSAEVRLMEEMNGIVTAAERAGLMICVAGLSTTSMVVAARASGVRLVAGNRIGPPQDRPRSMIRFDWPDLYRDGEEE